MARRWMSIRVELVHGRGLEPWPRPGRVFAAEAAHSFAQLATAIDTGFARWDLSHLHLFTLADRTVLAAVDEWDGEEPEGAVDDGTATLDRLAPGERFAYVFDTGDEWAHLCTVDPEPIDPIEELGLLPDRPLPYWGWGALPDQYGRRWDTDDGEAAVPRRPPRPLGDLPPLLPDWGPSTG